MLLKSSQATTLVDLQAELNAMILEPSGEEYEQVSPTKKKGDWSIDDFFA